MLRPAVATDRRITSSQTALQPNTDAQDSNATSLSNRPAPVTKTEDQTTGEQLAHQSTTTDALLQRQTNLELLTQSPTTAEQLQQTVIGTATAFVQAEAVTTEPSLFPQDPFNQAAQTAIGATVASTASTEPVATDEAVTFIGEPPIDEAWLATRNEQLDALSEDYQQQLQAARDDHGGVGWTSSARRVSARGNEQIIAQERVGIRAPNGEILSLDAPQALRSERGGELILREGYEYVTEDIIDWQFNEQIFLDHYRKQPNAHLDALATHYQFANSEALLAEHSGIVDLALRTDRAPNAGPGLDGFAMAPADDLAIMDIMLSADPELQALIDADTTPLPPPDNPIAQTQIQLYGAERFDYMQRHSRALASVRSDYTNALSAAHSDRSYSTPGWTVTTTRGPEGGTTGRFSVDAFTAQYIAQDNPSARAFANIYGTSSTQQKRHR